MLRALLHYFTGTGNSLHAAKELGKALQKNEYEITFHPIEKGIYPDIKGFDLHIFFFPIYATSVPHIMRKYIKHLPKGNNAKAAVISTNGRISKKFRDGYQGWALQQASLYLSLKNYNVILTETFDFPHNVTVAIQPLEDEVNSYFIEQAEGKILETAQKIIRGETYHRKYFMPNILWSLPFGIVYSIFGRRFIGKFYAADTSCTSCGLCVKTCPAKAIKKRSSIIKWGWNCEGCMRCINTCPSHSIQVSWLRIIALIAACSVTPLYIIQSLIPAQFYNSIGSFGSAMFNLLLNFLLSIVIFMILDLLIFGLSYVPGLRSIASFSHTSYFRRYNMFNRL